jgi:REG-2-like HAD superfamily hydrolase
MSDAVVLLDAGGTLFAERLTRDQVYAQVLAGLGIERTPDELGRLRATLHDALPESFEGHARYSDGWFRELVRRLLEEVGSDADAEDVRRRIARHYTDPACFVVHADAPPALEELASRGARLAVVSNWSERLPELLDGLGLSRFFEVVVASAAFGRSKPDPAIFHEALRRLGARPAAAWHIGDQLVADVAGARRAGLRALLLDRGSPAQEGAPHVIRSLEEVAAKIGL